MCLVTGMAEYSALGTPRKRISNWSHVPAAQTPDGETPRPHAHNSTRVRPSRYPDVTVGDTPTASHRTTRVLCSAPPVSALCRSDPLWERCATSRLVRCIPESVQSNRGARGENRTPDLFITSSSALSAVLKPERSVSERPGRERCAQNESLSLKVVDPIQDGIT